MPDELNNESSRIDIPPPNKFLKFIKGLFLFLLLIALIVGSFWVSFHLGRRILAPVKKKPAQKIEVTIPEPPPSIAGLQSLEELETLEAAVKKEVPEPEPEVEKPKTTVYYPEAQKYFKVQAGFFHIKSNALNLAKKIESNGFDTYVKKLSQGWRVQVGAFISKTRALNRMNALKQKGFTAIIVYE